MTDDSTNLFAGPRPKRRRRNVIAAVAPGVAWFLAIGALVAMDRRISPLGRLRGFAETSEITVAHLVSGVTRNVHVALHDLVDAGQILVTMDDTQDRLLLAAIEKDIQRLRGEVVAEQLRLETANAQAELDHADLARRFLVDREAAHVEFLSHLATQAADQITLRGTTIEFELVRQLYEDEDAPYRELNAIQTQVEALRERIRKNEEVLASKRETFQQADLRWHAFSEGTTATIKYDAVLTPLRLAVEVREAELNQVVRQIDSHVHRAPFAGQVTQVFVQAGDHLLAGDPLLTISTLRTDRAIAYLPERKILTPHVGDRVVVERVAATSDEAARFPGTVVSMSTTVSEAPLRYRSLPNLPVWGRACVVAVDAGALLPGEAITVAFANNQRRPSDINVSDATER